MANLEVKNASIISTGGMTLFICDLCNACYSLERSFKLHYRTHKNFTCDTCGKIFLIRSQLTLHLRSHETSKRYVCEVCDKGFNVRSKLKVHQRTHEKSFVCDVCKSSFSRRGALKKHYAYVCDVCQASFCDSASLQKHAFAHISEEGSNSDNIISDSKEDKIVISKLKVHERTHEKSFVCDVCKSTFSHKEALKKHYAIHTAKELYVCDVCQASFCDSASLQTHAFAHISEEGSNSDNIINDLKEDKIVISKLKVHERTYEKSFVCHVCKSTFSRKGALKKHYVIHAAEGLYVCDVCQATFCDSASLQTHAFAHISEEGSNSDNIINESKEDKIVISKLKVHERTYEKSFVCDVCKSTFSCKGTLQKHYAIHTAEGLYVCDVCQASFCDSASLQTHAFVHISEEGSNSDNIINDSKEDKIVNESRELKYHLRSNRRHECDICQRTFKSEALLEEHYRTHKGVKSHAAYIAIRAFSEYCRSKAVLHSRTRKMPHVCDLCHKAFLLESSLKSHRCRRTKNFIIYN